MRSTGIARGRIAIAVALALSGCKSFDMDLAKLNPWRPPEEQKRVVFGTEYACDEGKRLILRPGDATKWVMIVYPEREFRLDAAGAGRYSNGRTTLLLSGAVAELTEENKPLFVNCKLAKS